MWDCSCKCNCVLGGRWHSDGSPERPLTSSAALKNSWPELTWQCESSTWFSVYAALHPDLLQNRTSMYAARQWGLEKKTRPHWPHFFIIVENISINTSAFRTYAYVLWSKQMYSLDWNRLHLPALCASYCYLCLCVSNTDVVWQLGIQGLGANWSKE